MVKRILSVILAISIIFMLAPAYSFATGGTPVANFTQLKAALEDAVTTEIVLTDNILIEKKAVTINPNKASLVIDGNNKIIIDADINSLTYTLHLAAKKTLKNIVLKNAIIMGRNKYGLITVPDGSSFSDVTITYENVTYTGPQMIWARYSNVIIKDCNINVAPGYCNLVSYLVEAMNVTLLGNVQINKQVAGNCNELFQINYQGKMVIGANAVVNVLNGYDGTNTLLTSKSGFVYFSTCKSSMIFESGCKFTYTGMYAFQDGCALANLIVNSGADVTITTIGNLKCTHGLFYVEGVMTVDPGSMLKLLALYNTSCYPVIKFNNKSVLNVNSPRFFYLYNSSTYKCNTGLAIGNICEMTINYSNIYRLEYWVSNKSPYDALTPATWNFVTSTGSPYSALVNLSSGVARSVLSLGYSGTTPLNTTTMSLKDVNVIRINFILPM